MPAHRVWVPPSNRGEAPSDQDGDSNPVRGPTRIRSPWDIWACERWMAEIPEDVQERDGCKLKELVVPPTGSRTQDLGTALCILGVPRHFQQGTVERGHYWTLVCPGNSDAFRDSFVLYHDTQTDTRDVRADPTGNSTFIQRGVPSDHHPTIRMLRPGPGPA
jgi:hypothetical protein